MAKKINSIVLAKAILADLKSNRLKANELFMTDDGGYEISVGELRRFLRLAVESGKLRERIAELEEALTPRKHPIDSRGILYRPKLQRYVCQVCGCHLTEVQAIKIARKVLKGERDG